MNKKFSIIIPAHNSGETIPECLAAACLNLEKFRAEVVVADDCSSDDTARIAEKFPVKVLRLDKCSGAAAARNEGAKAGGGEILIFLDSDVLPAGDWLAEIAESFERNPAAAAMQGAYDTACPVKSLPSRARNYYKCWNLSKLADGAQISGLNSYCFAIRREVFEEVGGFCPAAERVEDVELGLRLAAAGYKIVLNKAVRVKHLKRYTFLGLLKCDYRKVLAKAALYLKGRQVAVSGATSSLNKIGDMPAELGTILLSGVIPAAAACALAFREPGFAYLAAAGALALFLLNLGFFGFMRRNGGVLEAAGCLAVYFCEMAAALAALFAGGVYNLLDRAGRAFAGVREKLRWLGKMFSHSPSSMPEQVTLFVTDKCNLKCRHCFYWRDLNSGKNNFELGELEKVLRTMGSFSFVSLTGGEPFLREDLPAIAGLLADINKVKRISIPTNGYMPQKTLALAGGVLEACRDKAAVLVKVSLDGIGRAHDGIRGVEGSFSRALETFHGLQELKGRYPHLKVGVLLTASALNEGSLAGTASYVMDTLSPDMVGLNFVRGDLKEAAVNSVDVERYRALYAEILAWQSAKREAGLGDEFYRAYKTEISGLIREISETGKYPMACYAGSLSAVIDSSLNVFPCELAGKKMGNLRDYGLDFRKLWLSAESGKIRGQLAGGNCCCTHECNLQMNSFFNPGLAAKLLVNTLSGVLRGLTRRGSGLGAGIKEGDLI